MSNKLIDKFVSSSLTLFKWTVILVIIEVFSIVTNKPLNFLLTCVRHSLNERGIFGGQDSNYSIYGWIYVFLDVFSTGIVMNVVNN